MEYTKISREELFALPKQQFIDRCLEWSKEFEDGKQMHVREPTNCPVHLWVVHNDKACGKELVPNTAVCPVCGNPCCPNCQNHSCLQISRVTGYLSDVSGWNAGKVAEFADRQRTDVKSFA